ncbi:MAG: hypothetical protein ABI645_01760 [Pseudomonadota bacterium]
MNNSCRTATALALTWVFTASSQNADDPPVPYEDVGGCPFEGCTYRTWQANAAIEIHLEPRNSSPIVATVAKLERVRALTGEVVTIKPGRVQFDKPQRLDTASGPINILPGQTLFLLTYQGEGFTKAWFNRRLYNSVDVSGITWANGRCGFSDPERCAGHEVEKYETEWWVQVRTASGQVGWTRETEKFDGKDAFGCGIPADNCRKVEPMQ